MNNLKLKLNKFKQILLSHIEDFFIGVGVIFINSTTFVINRYAGFYMLGLIFITVGFYIAKYQATKGR